MAVVYGLLPTKQDFNIQLQERADFAQSRLLERFKAAKVLTRMVRGYLLRKWLRWLAFNAIIIQCAFRQHRARKAYRAALRRAVRLKHAKYYGRAAQQIQALWRGHYSRRTKFDFYEYRRWLVAIKEKGDRKAAEAAEFGIRSKADNLRILEEEARKWLAFVVYKLHHLLRTFVCAGIYSDPATTQLSEFEELLKSIHYTQYMKRLKRKYDEFVKKHQPKFSNKRLFPIIGDGADYWYLSLAEMYELTSSQPRKKEDNRHKATYHGEIHEQPFLWRKFRPEKETESGREGRRGPFTAPKSAITVSPPPPAPTPTWDYVKAQASKDPRFHLYVKHYKPDPALFDYVNFHINVYLTRKQSIVNIDKK